MTSAQLPRWRPQLPRHEAIQELRLDIGRWLTNDSLRRLSAAWGTTPPDLPVGPLLAWYDDFSAEHWDFRAGRERNLAAKPTLSRTQSDQALETAHSLGLTSPRTPSQASYDYALVLGGLVRACIVRPRYAALLAERGMDFGQVVALGGFRPLAGDELPLSEAFGVDSTNEFGAMIDGIRSAFGITVQPTFENPNHGSGNLDWDVASFHDSSIFVIAAPSSSPDERRANSVDTYRWWAERAMPAAGSSVLLITTAIYVPYQGSGALEILGLEYDLEVETVGVPDDVADLGLHSQVFNAHNYLQEIRSAIRGVRSLHNKAESLDPS